MTTPAQTTVALPTVDASGGISDEAWESNKWDDDAAGAEDSSMDDILERWDAEEAQKHDDEDDSEEDEGEEVEKPRQRAQTDDGKEKPAKASEKADPKAKPASKAKDTAEARTYKVKLDGEEREVEPAKLARALGISETVLAALEPGAPERLYQKLHLAETRQRESTESLRQFETFLANIKGNPIPALQQLLAHKDIGLDLKVLAGQYLADEFQLEALEPAQRELHIAKRELERVRAEHARAEQQRQAEAEQDRRQRWAAQLNREITEALEGENLPADPRLRARMVSIMQRDRADRGEGVTGATPKELIRTLRAEMKADLLAFTAGMEPAALEEFLGPQIAKVLGEQRVRRFRQNSAAQTRRQDDDPAPRPRPKKRREISFDEVIRNM